MSNALVALGVDAPQINAVAAFDQSQGNAINAKGAQMQQARQGLEWVGSMALGAMGGKLDGQADPQKWEQGLGMLAQGGVDQSVVEALRSRPDLAPVIARASLDTMQQLQVANSERDYQLALRNFDLRVQEAAEARQARAAAAAKPLEINGQLVDPTTYQVLGDFRTDKPADLPAGVDEYNWYTQQEQGAGREPMSYIDFQQAKKGQGLSITTADGTVIQQGGGKPLTEAQSKDTVFSTRAAGSLPILDQYEMELTNPVSRMVDSDPTGIVRGAIQRPEFQQANQAGLEFLQAILRKDTGAAITSSEQQEYGRTFLPQPGDSAEVIAQKRQSRARAVEAIKAGMPPQAILNQEMALAKSGGAPSSSDAQSRAPSGEMTAVNPQTGERLVLRNGQWMKP